MKKTLLALALIGITSTYAHLSYAAPAEIKYDKFKDTTHAEAAKARGPSERWFDVVAVYPGQTFTGPTNIIELVFLSTHNSSLDSSWQYLTCHNFDLLADGKHVAIEKNLHGGQVHSGFVSEQVIDVISLDALKQLASASVVETQVCNTQQTLDSDDMDSLKSVAAELTKKEVK